MKLTLLDLALRTGQRTDAIVGVIESMIQGNTLLELMPFRGIVGQTLVYRRRVGLPSVSWTGFNQGVDKSKSKIIPVAIQTKFLNGMSECDKKLADKDPRGVNAYRAEEDSGFASAMANELNRALFYGNIKTNPLEPDGISAMLNALGGSCISAGGSTGAGESSIYALSFQDVNNVQGRIRGVEGLLGDNKNISAVNMGLQLVTDADSKQYPAYVTYFEFEPAFAVYDTRSVGRLCNIDATHKPTIPLLNQLITAMYPFRPSVLLCSKTVYNYIQDLKGTTFTTVQIMGNETELFKRVLTFDGIRIEIDENITATEAPVS